MNGIQDYQKSESVPNANQLIGTEKKCTKCKTIKPIETFKKDRRFKHEKGPWCKACVNLSAKQYYETHQEESIAKHKLWRKNNKEKVNAYARKYRKNNREATTVLEIRWRKKHPERVNEWRRKWDKKRRQNLQQRLSESMSASILRSIRTGKNNRHWEMLVDYTLEKLMSYLEKQFTDGMSWQNYGKRGWNIDHIIPKSVFNYEKPEDDDFKRCWSLKNLQPLWAKDNIRKSNKLYKPFQPSLVFKGELRHDRGNERTD
jgi:hypothetical protein